VPQPTRPNKTATPKPLSLSSLEKSALYYLERHACTVDGLRRVLVRKVRRVERELGPCAEAAAWIDDVIARCVRSGLVDDARFAEGRAHALRARGGSTRAIAQKLRMKGVAAPLVQEALARTDARNGDDDPELEAARAYARRKKLHDKEREKALASLARQGFSFHTAKRALESD
jgi:regulatory protein